MGDFKRKIFIWSFSSCGQALLSHSALLSLLGYNNFHEKLKMMVCYFYVKHSIKFYFESTVSADMSRSIIDDPQKDGFSCVALWLHNVLLKELV